MASQNVVPPTDQSPVPPVTLPGTDYPINPAVPQAAPPRPTIATAPPPVSTPAPRPSVPFAPKGRIPRPSNVASPGLSDMLNLAAPAPWHINVNLATNTFVPNFHGIANVVHECNRLMVNTYRFTRANPHWLPRLSMVYFAMLFYFRTLDCMNTNGEIDEELQIFFDFIQRAFDFRTLRIPGPLVPLFQAISLCNSGDELIGDICPMLPTDVPASSDTFWYLTASHYRLLPNILALLDYPTWLTGHATIPDTSTEYQRHRILSLHSEDVTALNQQSILNAVAGPGFHHRAFDTPETQNKFSVASLGSLQLPARIDQDTVNTASPSSIPSWKQFLRLARLPGEAASPNFRVWFSSLAALMSSYSDYFSQSCSLADIPTSAGASPHVLILYEPSTDDKSTPSSLPDYNAAVPDPNHPPGLPAFIKLPTLTSLAMTGELRTPSVPISHIEMGIVSQVNARQPALPNNMRNGIFWNAHSIRDDFTQFDIYQNTPTYVARYHSESSVRKLT
jgi:hypothetical protein